MDINKIIGIFNQEVFPGQPTEDEAQRVAIMAAEWEAHSLECERIEREVPAAERHTAFAELDARFKSRGIIDPTWRGTNA